MFGFFRGRSENSAQPQLCDMYHTGLICLIWLHLITGQQNDKPGWTLRLGVACESKPWPRHMRWVVVTRAGVYMTCTKTINQSLQKSNQSMELNQYHKWPDPCQKLVLTNKTHKSDIKLKHWNPDHHYKQCPNTRKNNDRDKTPH